MDLQEIPSGKLLRAQHKVRRLKGFYQHVAAYVIVNVIVLIFSGRVALVLLGKEALGNPEFMKWLNWNIWGTPIIWGMALLIHAISVFWTNPLKNWEERQIQKIMDREQ